MESGTGIGRVRGLGSVKAGAHHWLAQRLTALGNILLATWLLLSLLRLPTLELAVVAAWLASPWAAVPMLLLLASVLYHMRLGLTVLIEDYIHEAGSKFILLALLHFYVIGAFALGLFAIARLAFVGAPA